MEVSLRLRKLLAEHGLDRHGVMQKIAKDIGVERHTVAKLFKSRPASISLDLLSRVCTWLENNNVPAQDLPGALFSSGRTALWEALTRKRTIVNVYLGQYEETREQPYVASSWIASSDHKVSSKLVQKLSAHAPQAATGPSLNIAPVPFRYSRTDPLRDQELREHDIRKTAEIYRQIQARNTPESTIIIGSQRVNFLVEHFVASLFSCDPFEPVVGKPSVPFFSVYRKRDRAIPSCFGAKTHPDRRKDHDTPGLHYLNEKGQWATCPWVEDKKDAGLVITQRDHQRDTVTVAILGFTGRATEAVSEQLLNREKEFWPPTTELQSMDVGVSICRLRYKETESSVYSYQTTDDVKCDIIPITDRTLRRFIQEKD